MVIFHDLEGFWQKFIVLHCIATFSCMTMHDNHESCKFELKLNIIEQDQNEMRRLFSNTFLLHGIVLEYKIMENSTIMENLTFFISFHTVSSYKNLQVLRSVFECFPQ